MREMENERDDFTVIESEIPESCFCPITHEIFRDPVIIDGHTYERSIIQAWFSVGHNTNPLTNEALQSQTLTPNFALQGTISELLGRLPQQKREQLVAKDHYVALESQIQELQACLETTQAHRDSAQVCLQKAQEATQRIQQEQAQEVTVRERLTQQVEKWQTEYTQLEEEYQNLQKKLRQQEPLFAQRQQDMIKQMEREIHGKQTKLLFLQQLQQALKEWRPEGPYKGLFRGVPAGIKTLREQLPADQFIDCRQVDKKLQDIVTLLTALSQQKERDQNASALYQTFYSQADEWNLVEAEEEQSEDEAEERLEGLSL